MPFHLFKHIQTNEKVRATCQKNQVKVLGSSGDTAYRGLCQYEISRGMLSIKNLEASPQSQGLGLILLFSTALEAFPQGAERVETLATARDAYGFYLGLGFHPTKAAVDALNGSVPIFDMKTKQGKDAFNERLIIGRFSTATWTTELRIMKDRAFSKMDGKWEYESYSD